jgi:hypothetical protein
MIHLIVFDDDGAVSLRESWYRRSAGESRLGSHQLWRGKTMVAVPGVLDAAAVLAGARRSGRVRSMPEPDLPLDLDALKAVAGPAAGGQACRKLGADPRRTTRPGL